VPEIRDDAVREREGEDGDDDEPGVTIIAILIGKSRDAGRKKEKAKRRNGRVHGTDVK
jgi:hypothetical protein